MNLKKLEIINSYKRIQKILQAGNYFSGQYLKFCYIKNTNLDPNLKLLISVPKRKVKLAVNRNKIKRRIKEFYLQENNTKDYYAEVIIIYKYLKPVKYVKLEKDMLLFKKTILDI